MENTNEPTIDITKYMLRADITLLRCVDERQATLPTNGVEIPGGIYGIIDAIKFMGAVSEDIAWETVHTHKIPVGAHIDEHHGATGCGYGKLVETSPATVFAPEKVLAEDRLTRVRLAHGTVYTLLGDHHPTHAVITEKEGFSIDVAKANADSLGIFNYDKWAARQFGKRLGYDADAFADHLEKVFRATVTALTGITDFFVLK